jgi:hypothetical protein
MMPLPFCFRGHPDISAIPKSERRPRAASAHLRDTLGQVEGGKEGIRGKEAQGFLQICRLGSDVVTTEHL